MASKFDRDERRRLRVQVFASVLNGLIVRGEQYVNSRQLVFDAVSITREALRGLAELEATEQRETEYGKTKG